MYLVSLNNQVFSNKSHRTTHNQYKSCYEIGPRGYYGIIRVIQCADSILWLMTKFSKGFYGLVDLDSDRMEVYCA